MTGPPRLIRSAAAKVGFENLGRTLIELVKSRINVRGSEVRLEPASTSIRSGQARRPVGAMTAMLR
jgi:hypothetical protein